MTLKAVVENLDDVPENLREEYKEKDGKWYLELDETIRSHSLISPLANSLETLKREKKDLQTKLTQTTSRLTGLPDDFTPQKYEELVHEIDTLREAGDPNKVQEGLAKQRETYEQRLRDANLTMEQKLAEKDAVVAGKDSVIEKLIVDDGLTKALVQHNVGPHFLPAVSALLRPRVKMVVDEETGARSAVVDTDLGQVTVDKYVETWSKGDEGKMYVVKPAGGGAPGSGSGTKGSDVNPWKKDTINLTEQGRIIRADPAKARRLMSAAGWSEARINATFQQ